MSEITADELARAVEAAMRRVLADPQIREDFWDDGFRRLSDHAGNSASQWIGKRLLVAIIWAAVGAGIAWLVRLGALK